MAEDIANILIRLGADTSEGDNKLDEFRRGLEQFGHIKETAEAKVEVSGEDKLRATVAALNAFARTRATATAEVKVDEAPLEAALRKLKEFGAARTQVPGISVHPDTHPAELIPLRGGVTSADGGEEARLGVLARVKAKLDDFFNRGRSGFDDLRNRSSALDKSVDVLGHGLEDAVTKFGPALKVATEGFASFLDTIGGKSGVIGGPTSALSKVFSGLAESGPAAFIPIIAIVSVAVAAINSLIATLLALSASLVAAAGGVVALGVAFVVALGPAVLVAIGVFRELAQVIQVVMARSGQNVKQNDALKAALIQQRTAQDQLTKATTGGNQAAVNAIQQQKDAVLALANAYLGLQSAKLGITDAALALEQANLALKQFKSNLPGGLSIGQLTKKAQGISVTGGGPQDATPGGARGSGAAAELQFDQLQQNKERALLGVKQAAQQVADATNSYAKAQRAVTGGLGGTTTATNAATAAAQRLEKANLAVQRAQLSIDRAKGNDQFSLLSKAGKALVPIFLEVSNVVRDTFSGAIGAVLHSIGVAVKNLVPLISALKPAFTTLGKIMGGAIEQIAKALATPAMQKTFKELVKDSGKLIQVAVPGFIALLQIFLEIAKDAMPALLNLLKDLSGTFANVAKHPEKIARAINILIDSFRAWGPLIGKVIGVLGKFILLAAPVGDGLVKQITRLVGKFSDLLSQKGGRDAILKWLKDGVKSFTNMVSGIAGIITGLSGEGGLLSTLNRIGKAILSIGPYMHDIGLAFQVFFIVVLSPFNLIINLFKFFGNLIGKVAFFVYEKLGPAFKAWFDVVTTPLKLIWDVFKAIYNTIKDIIDAIGKIKLPNLTGKVKLFGHNINPLSLLAEGGIATKATPAVFGESGPEGIIPLTDQVFAQLGAAIAPNIAKHLQLVGGGHGGKTITQTNHIAVTAPAGHSPDTNHFIAAIENKLEALGAVA